MLGQIQKADEAGKHNADAASSIARGRCDGERAHAMCSPFSKGVGRKRRTATLKTQNLARRCEASRLGRRGGAPAGGGASCRGGKSPSRSSRFRPLNRNGSAGLPTRRLGGQTRVRAGSETGAPVHGETHSSGDDGFSQSGYTSGFNWPRRINSSRSRMMVRRATLNCRASAEMLGRSRDEPTISRI